MLRILTVSTALLATTASAYGLWWKSDLPEAAWRAGPLILPEPGKVATASVGSTMFERGGTGRVLVTNLKASAKWGGLDTYRKIAVYEDAAGIHGCGTTSYTSDTCILDADRDGMFEFAEIRKGKRKPGIALPAPVAYDPPFWEAAGNSFNDLRQQLVYNGAAGGVLRLGYREFINDLARPAFSNEVTFELSGKFPEEIAYKDIVIEVLGVSNAGIRYVIKPAAATAPQPAP